MVRILVIPGSARRDSFNRKLAAVAVKLGREMGAEAELLDPRDHVLPLYDGDLEEEQGLPDVVKEVKRKLIAADGLIFCSPEYNSSITPCLKNLIDWASRSETEDEAPLAAYRGKTAGLLSASPGAMGGMRGLVHLRSILGNIGVHVTPAQFALGGAHEKFGDDGALNNERDLRQVCEVVKQLLETAAKLSS